MWKWIISKNPNKKKLSFKNIKNFIVAWYRYLFSTSWEQRQVLWRIATKVPDKCLETGICYCECELPEKLYEDSECEGKDTCYPKWKTKFEWLEFEQTLDKSYLITAQNKLDKYGVKI